VNGMFLDVAVLITATAILVTIAAKLYPKVIV